jgi:hypothetical protein
VPLLTILKIQQVNFIKQDLRFAELLDTVTLDGSFMDMESVPLVAKGVKSIFMALGDSPGSVPAKVTARFGDGSPAGTMHSHGQGVAHYAAWLPGLSCEYAFFFVARVVAWSNSDSTTLMSHL